MPLPTLFAVLALACGAARADDGVERDEAVRRARFIPNAELKQALDKLTRPSDGPPVEGDPFVEKEALQARIAELLPQIERLETMKGGYARLSDPAAVSVERDALRAGLVAAQAGFNDALQRFNALRKRRQTQELQSILVGGKSDGVTEKIAKAMELEHFADQAKDVRLKTAAVLADDEEAFGRAVAEHAARAREKTIVAAAAGGLVLAGAGAWAWRRRRPTTGLPAPAGTLGPGTLLGGNFRIERELGRGGMGVVYEATDTALNRKVAVKQLRAELRQDPKEFELFLVEARLVAALKHPNIVEIHSVVDAGGEVCLVFEFVAGNPLNAVLQRARRLDLPVARGLLAQIGAALDYAHGQKIIHRDLKPANVMVTAEGGVKVMDFGLAHQAQQTVARQTRAESWGTPPYMAPEQELGAVSRESDLYSLAVLFYEALTGKLPFPGPNYLAQKRELAFVPVSRAASGLPPALDGVFARALHPDPARRFHSAAELAAAAAVAAGP